MRITAIVRRNSACRITTFLLAVGLGAAGPQAGLAANEDLAGLVFEPQVLAAATVEAETTGAPRDSAPGTATGAALPADAGVSEVHSIETDTDTDADADAEAGANSAVLRASIAALEADKGPYAAELASPLLALARLHQQLQDHTGAIEVASRAGQIARASFGLNTPEQFPAVELGISSQLAVQDYQQALEQQRALVHLHKAFFGPDAAETVPRLAVLGDMYFAAFERGLHRVPGGSGLRMQRGPESGHADPDRLSNEELAFLWLVQAQHNYVEAISILLKREDFFNPLLLTLETHVIETLFLQAYRRELERDPDFFMSAVDTRSRTLLDAEYEAARLRFYGDGERAYLRMLSYQRNDPRAQPAQIAATLLQLGDWHLLFGRFRQGRDVYAQARAFLVENGIGDAALEQLLNPPVPQQLPAFMQQPHSLDALADERRADVGFEGYIDVAFTVNEVGSVSGLEVLKRSPNTDRRVERRLRRVLRNAPFRPRIGPAYPKGAGKFELRYSFARL